MQRRKNLGTEIIPLIRRRERPREATLFVLRVFSDKRGLSPGDPGAGDRPHRVAPKVLWA